MQTNAINVPRLATSSAFSVESRNGRPDFELASALQKVSPKQQARAQKTATDFEAMFLNSMFSQMTSGLKGEGPFGDTPGTGVWRSMLTEQYSKNFANAGGVGVATEVYRTLILQQAKTIRTA
ncbi:flagellar assembly peptidoglycan hydrolase FlgJ [Bradyrhizobium diazoefficiens]|nr:flagellar assembly peptidoglycan hydrolase FlgJ [Bradyrhizobium diazoefficiens]MBR0811829.1 flagellar assembly peptidoglycan hydrolase FlgJ [Bradyrhizobium diazoefficiens]